MKGRGFKIVFFLLLLSGSFVQAKYGEQNDKKCGDGKENHYYTEEISRHNLSVHQSPIVAKNQTIVAIDDKENAIYCLNFQGDLKKKIAIGNPVRNLTPFGEGFIAVDEMSNLYFYDQNCHLKRKVETKNLAIDGGRLLGITNPIAISDKIIAVGAHHLREGPPPIYSNGISIFNHNGVHQEYYDLGGGRVETTPIKLSNGSLATGIHRENENMGYIYLINPSDKSIKISPSLPDIHISSLTEISGEKKLALSGRDRRGPFVSAYNLEDKTMNAKFYMPRGRDNRPGKPIYIGNGIVSVSDMDANIYSINLESGAGQIKHQGLERNPQRSPSIRLKDGKTLAVGLSKGVLFLDYDGNRQAYYENKMANKEREEIQKIDDQIEELLKEIRSRGDDDVSGKEEREKMAWLQGKRTFLSNYIENHLMYTTAPVEFDDNKIVVGSQDKLILLRVGYVECQEKSSKNMSNASRGNNLKEAEKGSEENSGNSETTLQ